LILLTKGIQNPEFEKTIYGVELREIVAHLEVASLYTQEL